MELRGRHPRVGTEFDWLSTDAGGRVAIFTTAGDGPVPQDIALHVDEVDDAIEQPSLLPMLGTARPEPTETAEGDYAEWFEHSRRGLYTYDWRRTWTYRRISTPTQPVELTDLPPALRAAAGYGALPIDFRETAVLLLDPTGHYGRPDVAQLLLDTEAQPSGRPDARSPAARGRAPLPHPTWSRRAATSWRGELERRAE